MTYCPSGNPPIKTLRFLLLSVYWWTAVRLPVAPPLCVNHLAAGAPMTVDTLLRTTRSLHVAAFPGLLLKIILAVGKKLAKLLIVSVLAPPLYFTVSSQALLQHEVQLWQGVARQQQGPWRI